MELSTHFSLPLASMGAASPDDRRGSTLLATSFTLPRNSVVPLCMSRAQQEAIASSALPRPPTTSRRGNANNNNNNATTTGGGGGSGAYKSTTNANLVSLNTAVLGELPATLERPLRMVLTYPIMRVAGTAFENSLYTTRKSDHACAPRVATTTTATAVARSQAYAPMSRYSVVGSGASRAYSGGGGGSSGNVFDASGHSFALDSSFTGSADVSMLLEASMSMLHARTDNYATANHSMTSDVLAMAMSGHSVVGGGGGNSFAAGSSGGGGGGAGSSSGGSTTVAGGPLSARGNTTTSSNSSSSSVVRTAAFVKRAMMWQIVITAVLACVRAAELFRVERLRTVLRARLLPVLQQRKAATGSVLPRRPRDADEDAFDVAGGVASDTDVDGSTGVRADKAAGGGAAAAASGDADAMMQGNYLRTHHPLFALLGNTAFLQRLSETMRRQRYTPGEVIARHDEPAQQQMFFLIAGRCEVLAERRRGSDGSRKRDSVEAVAAAAATSNNNNSGSNSSVHTAAALTAGAATAVAAAATAAATTASAPAATTAAAPRHSLPAPRVVCVLSAGQTFGGVFRTALQLGHTYRALTQCIVWHLTADSFEHALRTFVEQQQQQQQPLLLSSQQQPSSSSSLSPADEARALLNVYVEALRAHHMQLLRARYPLTLALLRRVPVYRRLLEHASNASASASAYMADFVPVVKLRGEVLFDHGDAPGDVYCLLEGSVLRTTHARHNDHDHHRHDGERDETRSNSSRAGDRDRSDTAMSWQQQQQQQQHQHSQAYTHNSAAARAHTADDDASSSSSPALVSQILSPNDFTSFSIDGRFVLLGEEPHLVPCAHRYRCTVHSRVALLYRIPGEHFVSALLDDAALYLALREKLMQTIRGAMRLDARCLARVPLLRDLSAAALHTLAQRAEARVIGRNMAICEPLQPIKEVYVIVEGEVRDPRAYGRQPTYPPANDDDDDSNSNDGDNKDNNNDKDGGRAAMRKDDAVAAGGGRARSGNNNNNAAAAAAGARGRQAMATLSLPRSGRGTAATTPSAAAAAASSDRERTRAGYTSNNNNNNNGGGALKDATRVGGARASSTMTASPVASVPAWQLALLDASCGNTHNNNAAAADAGTMTATSATAAMTVGSSGSNRLAHTLDGGSSAATATLTSTLRGSRHRSYHHTPSSHATHDTLHHRNNNNNNNTTTTSGGGGAGEATVSCAAVVTPDEQQELNPALPSYATQRHRCTLGGSWAGLLVDKWPCGWEATTLVELWAIPTLQLRTEFNNCSRATQNATLQRARLAQKDALGLSSVRVAKLPPMRVYLPHDAGSAATTTTTTSSQQQQQRGGYHGRPGGVSPPSRSVSAATRARSCSSNMSSSSSNNSSYRRAHDDSPQAAASQRRQHHGGRPQQQQQMMTMSSRHDDSAEVSMLCSFAASEDAGDAPTSRYHDGAWPRAQPQPQPHNIYSVNYTSVASTAASGQVLPATVPAARTAATTTTAATAAATRGRDGSGRARTTTSATVHGRALPSRHGLDEHTATTTTTTTTMPWRRRHRGSATTSSAHDKATAATSSTAPLPAHLIACYCGVSLDDVDNNNNNNSAGLAATRHASHDYQQQQRSPLLLDDSGGATAHTTHGGGIVRDPGVAAKASHTTHAQLSAATTATTAAAAWPVATTPSQQWFVDAPSREAPLIGGIATRSAAMAMTMPPLLRLPRRTTPPSAMTQMWAAPSRRARQQQQRLLLLGADANNDGDDDKHVAAAAAAGRGNSGRRDRAAWAATLPAMSLRATAKTHAADAVGHATLPRRYGLLL